MSRRALTYAVLLVTSVVVSACAAAPTGPSREDTVTCPGRGVVILTAGKSCDDL